MHVVEGQLEALVHQFHTIEVDRALQVTAAFIVVQRLQQVEGHMRRARSREVVQGVAIVLVQWALPQHCQQSAGLALRIGTHVQRLLPEVLDARLEFLHRYTGQVPAPMHVEAGADEGDIGVDLAHQRPVVLEADVAVGDMAGGLETAIVVVERPVVQVTADQADAIAHLAAGQRHVQPVGGALAHLGVDPEALGRRHRHIVQLGRQLQPGPRAVALEPDTTAHIGRVVGAFHAHRRSADTPATALVTPAHHLARQVQVMPHAKPVGQSNCSCRCGCSCRLKPSASPSKCPPRPRRPGELPTLASPATAARPVPATGHHARRPVAALAHPAAVGQEQPMAQACLEAITQRQRTQRRTGLYFAGTHPQLPANLQLQAIELLFAVFGLQTKARYLQRPTIGLALPAQARLQALQLQPRRCHVGHRCTVDAHVTQVRIGGQRHRREVAQGQPQVQLTLAFAQAHATSCQQRRPGMESTGSAPSQACPLRARGPRPALRSAAGHRSAPRHARPHAGGRH